VKKQGPNKVVKDWHWKASPCLYLSDGPSSKETASLLHQKTNPSLKREREESKKPRVSIRSYASSGQAHNTIHPIPDEGFSSSVG